MTTAAKALPKPRHRKAEEFILPHNLEAERATLGAALLSSTAADYLCDRLNAEAYFRRPHQTLFTAIRTLREQGSEIDNVTLKEQLGRIGKLDDVGGPVYIANLTDGVPRSVNIEHYAGILRDLQVKRALVAFANQTIDLVAEASHASTEIVVDSDRRLMELRAGYTEGRMQSLAASSAALHADLEWRVAHKGQLTGIPTGFQSIDELTLGWQPADMIIIAARPSIGKTTFVMNSAIAAARSTGSTGRRRRVAVFSLEMRRIQIEYRILAQLSRVPLSRLLSGHLTEGDYPLVSQAMCDMAELQIEIDDRAAQTAWDIRGACRRLQAEGGLDQVIIDYVQLMSGSLERRGATRNEEITDISRRLKGLGDELGVPMLVLSQLSRANESRPDPRPKLSDLRESGSLEQDADMVAMLHRKNHREGGVTNFILEKQRNGPTGTLNLTFDRDINLFEDGGVEPTPEPAAQKPARAKAPVTLFPKRGRSE